MNTCKASLVLALVTAGCFLVLAGILHRNAKASWDRLDERQELDDRWYGELQTMRLLEQRLHDIGRIDHFWEYQGEKKNLWQEAVGAKENVRSSLSLIRNELRNVRGRFANEDSEKRSLLIAKDVLENLAQRENRRLESTIEELQTQEDPK